MTSSNTEQLLNRLRKGLYQSGSAVVKKTKVAFLFTGQGSQYVEMAKSLYVTHPNFRESLNSCAGQLQERYGVDLFMILGYTKSEPPIEGSDLNSSIFSQPAIFCIEICLAQLWNSFGIFPEFVLGHSVGEFAAAVAAGIISFDDGLKLVVERSRLVNKLESGSMSVVRTSRAAALKLISEFSKKFDFWIDVAAINSENEIVVSGRQAAIQHFCAYCSENSVKTQQLLATHAFHSRDMDLVLKDYERVTRTVATRQSNCKYISGTLAKEVGCAEFTPTYWSNHLRAPVNFQGAFSELSRGNDEIVFVEIGPQPVLLALGMACVSPENTAESIYCPTIRKGEDNWSTILTSMAKMYTCGVEIDWVGFDSVYRRQRLTLPNYPFQREQFWLDGKSENSESLTVNSKLIQFLMFGITLWVVADKVILPGAGYLEVILAAGLDIICGGTHANIPLHVEDFTIESALVLEEEQFVQIQTVVSSRTDEEQLKYTVEIFKQIVFDPSGSDGGKWKRMASARFIPSASLDDSTTLALDISSLQSRLTSRETADDIYKKIAEMGITFGPSFKSIERFWYSETELLVQTSCPAETEKYVRHPVVLDAMIQACVASISLSDKNMKGLYLPMFIGKFISLPNKGGCSKLYIYSRRQSEGLTQQCVKLFTEAGQQVASMEGLDMIQTTVPAFLRLTNSEVEKYPAFYDEIWERRLGPWVKRQDLSCDIDTTETAERAEIRRTLSTKKVQYEELAKRIADLPYRYILKAIVGMGWNYMPGDIVVLTEFAGSSGILPKHLRVLRRWLYILVEEGDLCVANDVKGEFLVRKGLPSAEVIETGIADMMANLASKKYDDVEVKCAQVCGEKLESIIKGKVSVYSVLYPDAAASLYRSDFIRIIHGVPKLIFKHHFASEAASGKGDTILRIIEVGAGTGSQAEMLFSQLKELGLKYEYTFTDVSPLFLNEATKLFAGNKNIKYKLLDLERDPLGQGFPYQYYDALIADSVLHATENIRVTLGHVKDLLRPSGVFIFNEQVDAFRIMDISFTFMEGWWRFNDFELRKDSPILSKEAWSKVLASEGFSNPFIIGDEGGAGFPYRTFVATSPLIVEPEEPTLPPSGSQLWLIFGGGNAFPHHIGNKLAKVGRRSIFVELASTTKSHLSEGVFTVNPFIPEHFQQLFSALSERNEELEGIIFLCGMLGPFASLDETCDFDKIRETNFAQLHLLQAITAQGLKPNMFVVTNGAQFVEEQEPNHPISATLWGMLLCFNNEYPGQRNVLIDLDPGEELATSATDLFYLLWQKDPEFQIALRGRNVYYKRLLLVEPYKQSLTFPNTDRYKLQNPPSGLFSDFAIIAAVRPELGPRDVEVKMKCTSLNFKDVIMAMAVEGMSELQYGEAIRNVNEVGLDICGVVVSVGDEAKEFEIGDEVIGSCAGGALASHVVVHETMLVRKPQNMSIEEAALLNVIFLTAYYFLIEVGALKKEDKVLIHTASGGVGLAAIQVVNSIGAELFVTAGSRRKRNYLRSLGIKNVYNSRNTNFAKEIHVDTNGHGVDVVLNSITGPGFKEATLSVCAEKARFLEMSKFNVWTGEDVASLRPDVFYFIQEISPARDGQRDDGGAFGDESAVRRRNEKFVEQLKNEKFQHIPFTLFPLSRTEDAFRYIQDTKQIGKVVIKIPETTFENGKVVHLETFFNPSHSYLITGGMGGIGLEVAKWMAGSGAQYIVLVGRSPPSARAEAIISGIRGNKVNVLVIQADVSEYSQCERILKEINDVYPPLKGIMHAAGVTSDNAIGQQNMESFMKAYKPKIQGTMNLHVLTKSFHLDHFVLFSSVVSTVGGIGQCNHAAANKYLDAFAQYRVESGLPCCCVNWGPWSDVGAAVGLESIEGAFGLRMFTPAQGIAALERALFAHRTNTAVFDIAEQKTVETAYNLGNFFEYVKQRQADTTSSKVYEARIKALTEAEPHERRKLVREFIEFCLRDVLKLGEDETLDPDQDFREMGVDSLMGMEIRSRMQPLLAAFQTRAITLNEVQANRTINKMTNLICNSLNKSMERDLSAEELLSLAVLDSHLSEDIVPLENDPPVYEINSVLLTGVTGLLGPHVLAELLRQRNGLNVTCLVRAKSNEEARNRLDAAMKSVVMENALTENVVCVGGDVANRNFGLGDNEYEALENSVDAILHLAACSNHFVPYGPFGEGDVRSTNVLGLKHVLKFAATGKTKRLLFPGHIYSIRTRNSDGSFPDEFPAEDEHGMSCMTGYLQSKVICEKLLKQAIHRGLHVMVLRQHHLLGDSRTGVMDVKRNYTGMLLFTCQKMGKFPKFTDRYLTGVAADVAANISVKMLLKQDVEAGVYNVNNPKASSVSDLHVIFERKGVKVDLVPYDDWKEAAILHFGGFDPTGEAFSKNLNDFLPEYLLESESPDAYRTLFANSAKIKKWIPDIDELMVEPIEVAKVLLAHYEETMGPLA